MPATSAFPTLTPPQEDEGFDRLRLLRSRRVGPTTFHRMLAEHGSARAALAALPDVARAAGVTDYQVCPPGVVAAEIRAARLAGARLVHDCDADYPHMLRELNDRPPVLWALGRTELLSAPLIALVGARNASSLGTRMARRLADELGAAGYVVVSGLARGIDAAAHLAALDSGTIAVQAGGVDVIYPLENAGLAHDIAARGLRLSEDPMGLQPQARHFPARNRIIAGIAQAVVVVEAAAKSGSLITARNALDMNRDVLAVPGHPFDARAAGCNMLIRDGAVLVRSAADVIEALAPLCNAAGKNAAPATSPRTAATVTPAIQPTAPAKPDLRSVATLHDMILDRLSPSPLAVDQLSRDLAVPQAQLGTALVDLELSGQITRQAGGLLTRAC